MFIGFEASKWRLFVKIWSTMENRDLMMPLYLAVSRKSTMPLTCRRRIGFAPLVQPNRATDF